MTLDFNTYPPRGHQDRITAYERFEKVFLGRHKELWNLQPGKYQLRRYIVANFAGLGMMMLAIRTSRLIVSPVRSYHRPGSSSACIMHETRIAGTGRTLSQITLAFHGRSS